MKRKKVDISSRDLVGDIMNELLVDTSHYITTGVPPHILLSRLSRQLVNTCGDMTYAMVQKKAEELIDAEVKNETLVRFPSGNYLHGPRKTYGGQSTPSADESDSVPVEEFDDEDEDEDYDHQGKTDTDYTPDYMPKNFSKKTMKRSEGRTSGRMKKSRFDSDEYVFPTIVKNLNKRSPAPVQEKGKKRPGPKPKKKCPICASFTGSDTMTATCATCPVKAHVSCVEKEMATKGKDISLWSCCYCKPTNRKWKCSICNEGGSKEMGVLVSCETCSVKYHRFCHTPTIMIKQMKNWKCTSCTDKLLGPSKDKSADQSAETSTKLEESEEESDNLDLSLTCVVCQSKFYNPANKLKCAECKYLFHTRCCRVRTAENALRLGSKRHKWKCDECILGPSGMRQAESCRVVIPRLQLKSEPLSESSDERGSVSCKRSRRQPKKRGRFAGQKISTPGDDSNPDVEEEKEEEKCEKEKVPTKKFQKEWWAGRLKPITVEKNQPQLGPIPDLSVPDVTTWSSMDVENYFHEYFLDKSVGQVFADQDIDGKALKLMRRIDVLKTFDSAGFKLDIIMDVMQHVKRLQLRVNDRRYIWADIF